MAQANGSMPLILLAGAAAALGLYFYTQGSKTETPAPTPGPKPNPLPVGGGAPNTGTGAYNGPPSSADTAAVALKAYNEGQARMSASAGKAAATAGAGAAKAYLDKFAAEHSGMSPQQFSDLMARAGATQGAAMAAAGAAAGSEYVEMLRQQQAEQVDQNTINQQIIANQPIGEGIGKVNHVIPNGAGDGSNGGYTYIDPRTGACVILPYVVPPNRGICIYDPRCVATMTPAFHQKVVDKLCAAAHAEPTQSVIVYAG